MVRQMSEGGYAGGLRGNKSAVVSVALEAEYARWMARRMSST